MSRLPLRALLLGAVALLAVYVNQGGGAFGQSAVNSLDGFRACPRQQAECPGSLRAERGLKGGELRVSWERVPTPPLNATTVTVVVDDGEQPVVRQVPAKDTFADFDSLARGRDLEVTAALTRDGHVISETCTLRLRSTQTDTRDPTPRDPPRPPGPFALLPVPNSVAAGYNIAYWTKEDGTLGHDVHLVGPTHGINILGNSGNRTPPTGTHSGAGVGYRTACAIRQTDDPDTDGTLNCWGVNFGNTLPPPADLGAVVHVSLGAIHICALLTDDTIRCWGRDNLGQSKAPEGAFHTVDSGWLHTCGLRTDGSVVCWGDDRRGQSSVPPALRKARSARAIATGQRHSCAVRADYTVTCWGRSDLGQLRVPADLGPVTALSAGSGSDHTCAIKANGAVACWGDARYGQVSQVPAGTDWVEISVGYVHTCGRRADGTVACWRIKETTSPPMSSFALIIHNSCGIRQADSHLQCWGALLTFDGAHRWVDGRGVYPVAFKAVSHGEDNLCGILKEDSTLECWGGLDGSRTNITPPSDLGTVKAIGTFQHNACAVKTDDTLTCWGKYGSAGENDPNTVPSNLGTVKAVATSVNHTCAVKTDDTLACWGDSTHGNAKGQLTIPANLGTVKKVALGNENTCVVKANDNVQCWGSLPKGIAVPDLGTVKDLVVYRGADSHACAIKADDTVACWWGSDNVGTVPADLGKVHAVGTGLSHACAAIKRSDQSDRTVKCWGTAQDGAAGSPRLE